MTCSTCCHCYAVDVGYSCGLQDGAALSAKFSGPRGITFDYTGNLYVADRGNSCIRKISPDGVVTTVLPGGVVTQPYDLDISHKGELVVTDAYQVSTGRAVLVRQGNSRGKVHGSVNPRALLGSMLACWLT